MDKLLEPNFGLIVWTIVMFVLLVGLLTKVAWRPILEGLEKREGKIRGDLDRAEKAARDAETMRARFETQLAEAQKNIQDMMAQAKSDGEKNRAVILASAREEAEKLVEKGRKDLAGEAEKLKVELRDEIAGLAMAVTEKVLEKSVDRKLQEQVFQDSVKEIVRIQK